jgi:hypothetical protein
MTARGPDRISASVPHLRHSLGGPALSRQVRLLPDMGIWPAARSHRCVRTFTKSDFLCP